MAFDVRMHGRQRVSVSAMDCDLCSVCSEQAGDRGTDAPGTAGDQRDLALD
jgi:hypothetical protein